MKVIVTLVLVIFLYPFIATAQKQETGLWVKANLITDQGRYFPAPANTMVQFIKYRFTDDGTAKVSMDLLFSQTDLQYTITGSLLRIGFVNYQIDKFTKDTLVFHQVNDNNDETMVNVYVKSENVRVADKPVYNEALKDSVYIANRYLFPECNITENEIIYTLGDYHGQWDVSFVVNKLGKVVNMEVLGDAGTDPKFVKDITRAYQSRSVKWTPAKINGVAVNCLVKFNFNYVGGYEQGRKTKAVNKKFLF